MSTNDPARSRRPAAAPVPGTQVRIPLTADPADLAVVRLLAVPGRDLTHGGHLSLPLAPFAEALLVDVAVGGRVLLPGAWVEPEVLSRGEPIAPAPVTAADLRLPAVIVGGPEAAELHWGETVWPLPLRGMIAVPAAARAAPHPLSRLRRLTLVAAGRREEVGLSSWREAAFEVPWKDVRLLPGAERWFDIAQVPSGMRYADAERAQGVGRSRRRA